MSGQRHDALTAAAQERSRDTRQRAVTTIRSLDKAGLPLTMTTVAHAAGVSRSWLYTQPDLHDEITKHRHADLGVPPRERASDDSQRQRIEDMHDQILRLNTEVLALRQQLAQSFGQQRADRTRT